MIPEQWFLALQLLHKDFRKVLMGQISTLTIWPARGGKEKRRREYKRRKRQWERGIEKLREKHRSIKN